jgi:hypothetical protein
MYYLMYVSLGVGVRNTRRRQLSRYVKDYHIENSTSSPIEIRFDSYNRITSQLIYCLFLFFSKSIQLTSMETNFCIIANVGGGKSTIESYV